MTAIMQDINWNDIRVFLAVAETGKIASAAQVLKLDATTLGRRVKRLEARLQTALFERTRNGQALTEAGEKLLSQAEAMASAARAIDEEMASQRGLSGVLRLSVSEGFGSRFLTHYMGDFADRHPNLSMDLVASSGFLSPSKREADIAVMLSRPKVGPVLCQKLADYRLMLYASTDYLDRAGRPRNIADLSEGHRLIGYVPDLVYAPELNYLEDFQPGLTAQLRSSSINAQHRLVSEGAGIGVLPQFIAMQTSGLEIVCPEQSIIRSFWIVTHKDTRRLAKVRAGKDWLQNCVEDGQSRLMPSPAR
jgi:DNA-binding transcriptional LysR family regulator